PPSVMCLLFRRRPRSTLFPYTTLFRSLLGHRRQGRRRTTRKMPSASAARNHQPGAGGHQATGGGAINGCKSPRLLIAVPPVVVRDRKSTRLNSSHVKISYAVFCLKKKR